MMTGQMVRQLVVKQVAASVKKYLHGDHDRRCVTCNNAFKARTSRHVFCETECRTAWYRGWFFPKKRG